MAESSRKVGTSRAAEGPQPVPVVTSDALLGPLGRLSIMHNGERYTLRITANNKLILTK